MRDISLRFLTRPGCHLCDEARPFVAWAAGRNGLPVVEIDVDGDDRLLAEYGLRIPVILGPDGQVLAEGAITDRRALKRALRALR